MICEKCGAQLAENADTCPICGETIPVPVHPKTSRKPHIALRLLLQFFSFVLCIVLMASLLGTVVLADLNRLMSSGGIQQLIRGVLTPASAAHRLIPAVGAAGIRLEDSFTIPGDLDLGDLPEDLLTGGASDESIGGIIDWIYQELEDASEEPLPITKEQVQEFVEESTISEFVADKLAGFAEDFINGTEHTTITAQEVMDLLEENGELIEQTFDVAISEDIKQQLADSVNQLVLENDLNTVIRDQVFETVKETINESTAGTGMTWEDIQPAVQWLCSDSLLFTALGSCLVLMVLLCLLNFYNVPAGLTWIGVPSILVGGLLVLPLAALQAVPEALGQAGSVLLSFADVLMPIHAAPLVLGFGLVLVGIIWRILRSKRPAA